MNNDEELRWVRRRDGSHRSSSRSTPGYERDLLREDGTEDLLGPTESRPADLDEIAHQLTAKGTQREPMAQALRTGIAEAIMDALQPYIERGVDIAVDSAVAGIPRLWNWAKNKASRINEKENLVTASIPEVFVPPSAVELSEKTELKDPAVLTVTADQYQALLLSALLADQYAAQARALLASVHIDDDVLPEELETAVRSALAGPASPEYQEKIKDVVELLGNSGSYRGEFVLVRAKELQSSSDHDPL